MSDAHCHSFDVVVIGAGPAGAAAAFTCRKQGLRVALIDKNRFPRNKLCGGLFTQRSLNMFSSVYSSTPPQDILVQKEQVEFWFAGEKMGEMDEFPPLYLTMRWDLDDVMFNKAIEAGAEDFTGRRVRSMDCKAKHLCLEDGAQLDWKILIGADGVNSQVARALFGATFDKSKIGFGLEVEVPKSETAPAMPVRIDFNAADWGYGWSFPKRKTTTVGVGGLQRLNTDMKQKMADYLKLLGVENDHSRVKGHFIPFGDFRKFPAKGPVLLCGDAAGLVDPITGEGIALAMESGRMAAEVSAEAIARGTPEQAAELYQRRLKSIHQSLRIARWLRAIMFSKPTQKPFMKAFKSSKTMKHEYMRLLAGEIEYPELGRAFVKRIPKIFLRAFQR